MSEAEPAIKEESPTPNDELPVAAATIDDRRSSSVEVGNGDTIVLHSIFYNGKALKITGANAHIFGVVFRILKNVCDTVKQLAVAFDEGWDTDPKPDQITILKLIKLYNRCAKPFATNWSGSYNTETLGEWGQPNCSSKVAAEITSYSYECAVPRPADLNHYYKSFTSETYGETNLEQMASIVDEMRISKDDIFIDLGSGIGQLVCFTAAYAKCKKCVGIELSDLPSKYATDLGIYFKKLMSHFGKNHGKYEHIQGDFLNPKFKKLICEEATVIFINNFAFSPDLMFRITTELLQDLKHGTKIVTTKPFGDHRKDITYRSTSDINAISHTRELTSMESGVSWTANKVKFYETVMDHTKLIKYYEEERRKKLDPTYKGSREGSETEQAAASNQSPKWNEPDTEYAPPSKKSKKEKHDASSTISSGKEHKEKESKEKKKKSMSITKPAKTPKNSHSSKHGDSSHHRSSATSNHHSIPSQPKATAPPPTLAQQQAAKQAQLKADEQLPEPDMLHAQLDAKTMNALHTIRQAATTSAQAAAINDAIASVLSQSAPSPQQARVMSPPTFPNVQSLPAPIPLYPQTTAAPPPPPPSQPPQQQQQQKSVVLPNSELLTEARHTFMIPPTDPLYSMIVSYYFEVKRFCNQAKTGDPDIVQQLIQDIENERIRKNELTESMTSTNTQIDELLQAGVHTLKDRLDKLGMHSVTDVSELLAGSKQIVTQHKGLTNNVAHMENNVALEEQRLKMLGGPDALRCFDEADHDAAHDIMRLSEIIISRRAPDFVPQILPEDSPSTDSKISPSSRKPRQPRPRQNAANGGKRGNSGGGGGVGRKSDPTEDVEMEIRQFVQHALKVDNAVKEKERKARGNLIADRMT